MGEGVGEQMLAVAIAELCRQGCKLLTHSCSKSHSSSGTAGQLAAGNHLIEKIPVGARFTAFRMLLRYLWERTRLLVF